MQRLGMTIVAIALSFGAIYNYTEKNQLPQQQVVADHIQEGTPLPLEDLIPSTFDITTKVPDYQNYDEVVTQIKEWEQEANEIVEVGTYGKSSRGKDIYYIRINSGNTDNPRVLITASIHGNEPHSTSTIMAYIGTMLHEYGRDELVTELIDNRDIYFVPVVSPDSYPHSRHVDGVDPNRNFPTERDPNKRSVPPVQALRDFFLKIKANAVISGHTYGRLYLYPWGDKTQRNPNHDDYARIVGKMSELSRYTNKRACQMYNRPIFGTELDWYHRNGAFAIVMEFGTHQRRPSMNEIKREFDMTKDAITYFIKEAPIVEIK